MNAQQTPPILFIAGVHGVGKTTFCRCLEKSIEAETISASEIIKNKTKINKDKSVKDIDGNQDILVGGLSELGIKNSYIILDGHFCLLDKQRQINFVPTSTFRALNIFGIILLKCDPVQIYKRLTGRDGRGRWDPDILGEMQSEEGNRARVVADMLNVPIVDYDNIRPPGRDHILSLAQTFGLKNIKTF